MTTRSETLKYSHSSTFLCWSSRGRLTCSVQVMNSYKGLILICCQCSSSALPQHPVIDHKLRRLKSSIFRQPCHHISKNMLDHWDVILRGYQVHRWRVFDTGRLQVTLSDVCKSAVQWSRRRYPVCAAGCRCSCSSGWKQRTLQRLLRLRCCCCFGFGLLLSQQLRLSDQRGLVAGSRRPAPSSLHHHGAVRVHDLFGGEKIRCDSSMLMINDYIVLSV